MGYDDVAARITRVHQYGQFDQVGPGAFAKCVSCWALPLAMSKLWTLILKNLFNQQFNFLTFPLMEGLR